MAGPIVNQALATDSHSRPAGASRRTTSGSRLAASASTVTGGTA